MLHTQMLHKFKSRKKYTRISSQINLNNRKSIFILFSDAIFYSIFFYTEATDGRYIVAASNINYLLKHKRCLSIEKDIHEFSLLELF